MARVGTVDEKTQSAYMARTFILHGTSSDDPVTYRHALNNSSHQHDLPKDESNGSKLFINAIKHGGAPSGKRSKSGDDKKDDTKPSGENSGDTKPAVKDQDDSKPSEKIDDDKDPSKDKKIRKTNLAHSFMLTCTSTMMSGSSTRDSHAVKHPLMTIWR